MAESETIVANAAKASDKVSFMSIIAVMAILLKERHWRQHRRFAHE
ncbi:hypothetical protein [Rhizobium wenxiniae]|nr:hypothetical protein [Rhizobium wenxiniae]